MELLALQKIEEVCQRDLDRHCRLPRKTMADPVMQWLFTPERLAPPPLLHPNDLDLMDPMNLGPLLDHMMDTALHMPMMVQREEPMFVMFFEGVSVPQERAPEEVALDSMVSRLMQHSSNCDKKKQEQAAATGAPMVPKLTTPEVAHHIRLKGQHVLEQEDVPEERRRLARRLTEVTPEEIMVRFTNTEPFDNHFSLEQQNHNHDHPPCPHKHKCLMKAREQNMVTPECGDALTRLEYVQKFEMEKNHEMFLYMQFFWFYCILFFALFTMILVRKFKNGKGRFLLRLRVLQSVYSNPEIKAKVEDDIGVPLGNVPPLSNVALKLLNADGRNQCRRKRQRFCHMLYLCVAFFALDAFGALPPGWPLFVMGFCCVFMISRIATLCYSKPEVRECKCCCCGGSTSDVENGTVSDVQACCTCCKGTGVCSAKCKTCCGGGGDNKDGAGSCCGGKCSCAKDHNCDGSCDCCGPKKECCGTKKECFAMEEVKLIVKDDCTCCCCGGSMVDFATGNVSDVQACCTCCKGTGKCSAKCKSCCGGGGKKDGTGSCCGGKCSCAKEHNCNGDCDCCGSFKKVVVDSNTVVYHGIPVQIV
jgi:hypothetical protein